jgi:hypothetical protein
VACCRGNSHVDALRVTSTNLNAVWVPEFSIELLQQ